MELVRVLLGEIDLSSENYDRYLFNYGRDSNAIIDSIKKVGLINSVILKKTCILIRHILLYVVINVSWACQKLGWESIEAKVIDGLSDEETLLLALHDNLSSRGMR